MLSWFARMERMEEYQLVKRIVGSNMRDVRLRERRRTGRISHVKIVLNEIEITVERGG